MLHRLLTLALLTVSFLVSFPVHAQSRGAVFYNEEELNALVASVISGSSAPNLLDAIFGSGKLFETTGDSIIPKLVGAGSLYHDSAHTRGRFSLVAPAVGDVTKLPDKNRGLVYDNGTTMTRLNMGVFNVRDFGAKDDDATDNAVQLQAAIDAAVAEGGGVVRLSYGTNGVYRISTPIVYKQGVILEGETSALGAKVKLRLTSNNSNAVTVGENLTSIYLRNLELYAVGSTNTKGILFTGSGANATQMVTLENLTINGFTRGISVEATDVTKVWQMSYVTARNITVHDCLYGVYLDSMNSDWNFDNLLVFGRKDSYGVYVANGGALQFNHPNFIVTALGAVCTAGVENPNFGAAAIQVEGHHGPITVINAQQEGFRKTLVQNFEDWTYPIVFMNTVMGAPIELNADTVFVSIGNYYYDDTVQAKADTRIYSMGDSVDTRNHCLAPGTGVGGFVLTTGAFIIKRESIYGTDYQMPVSINAAAPRAATGNPNNPSVPLFNIGSPNTPHVLMRLGQTDSVTRAFTGNYYDVSRDTDGLLNFFGNQAMPFRGIKTNGTIKALHYAGSGGAPTVTAGSVAVVGVGAIVSLAGTDSAFEVTLRTGAGAHVAGTLFTVTFNTPYSSAPYEVFSASSSDSADLTANVGVYSTSTTNNILFAARAAFTGSKTYKFKFHVKQ
jgi:hypothetical protein